MESLLPGDVAACLAPILKRRGIAKASLFGSVAAGAAAGVTSCALAAKDIRPVAKIDRTAVLVRIFKVPSIL